MLFLDMYPQTDIHPSHTGNYWLFIPNAVSGRVALFSDIRLTVYSPTRLDILSGTDSSQVGTGQVLVHDVNIRGVCSPGNANRYLSPYAHIALMPKELAEVEGLTYQDITPADWTTPKIILKHLDDTRESLQLHRDAVNLYQFK